MRFGNLELELFKRYELLSDAAHVVTIDKTNLYYILDHVLYDYVPIGTPYKDWFLSIIDTVGLDLGRSTFIWDMEEYNGDLSYRIRKLLELQGIRMTERSYANLSQRINAHGLRRLNKLQLELSNTIDWDSGYFPGENPGSCWWDERYANGKVTYLNHIQTNEDGFILKFYDADGNPFGRAYAIYASEGNPILFNIYMAERYSQEDLLNLLSSFVGVPYYKKSLVLNSVNSVYINGDVGYVFQKREPSQRMIIHLDSYDIPYNPEIEVLRLSRSRFQYQKQCQICNRYYQSNSGSDMVAYVKPYKIDICIHCRNSKNIHLVGPVRQDGMQVYFDNKFYKPSAKDRSRIVKIAGKAYEPQ